MHALCVDVFEKRTGWLLWQFLMAKVAFSSNTVNTLDIKRIDGAMNQPSTEANKISLVPFFPIQSTQDLPAGNWASIYASLSKVSSTFIQQSPLSNSADSAELLGLHLFGMSEHEIPQVSKSGVSFVKKNQTTTQHTWIWNAAICGSVTIPIRASLQP